jgi:ankyrin repeat protein
VNGQDSEGKSPLIYAAKEGYTEVVRYLLGKKANPLFKDAQGKTALGYAEFYHHIEIINILK